MQMRRRWTHGVVILLSAFAALVCSDAVAPDPSVTPLEAGPLVSDPLGNELVSQRMRDGSAIGMAGLAAGSEVTWVSLPEHTADGGATAAVRRLGDEGSTIVSMREGGFEPVAVNATETDTIEIVVRAMSGATLTSIRAPVKPKRPPTVVRTYPPRGKPDLPVNATLVIVVSEPVRPSSITAASLRLVSRGRDVGGQVRVLPGDGTMLAFTPSAPLEADREYRLVVDGGITDVEGDPIGTNLVLAFTTNSSSVGPPATVAVHPDSSYLVFGESYQYVARVFDAAGNLLVDAPVTWGTDSPQLLSVSPTGLVTALGDSIGGGYVTATVGGFSGAAFVYVIPRPTSLVATPAMAELAVGDTTTVEVVARQASGDRVYVPLSIQNLTPAVASITLPFAGWSGNPFRVVRGLSPGDARFIISVAGLADTVDMVVRATRPVAVARVAPRAAELAPQGSLRLAAWLWDANGIEIQTRPPVTWTSRDPAVATVDGTGLVTAAANGTVMIVAEAEGEADSASITVTADPALRFAAVDASLRRTCGLTTAGDAYCWGYGPLGDGAPAAQVNRPRLVIGGLDFAQVTAGRDYIGCGRTVALELFCWGDFATGRYLRPQRFASSWPVADAQAGAAHLCVVTSSGEPLCWGANGAGQLGDGTTVSHYDDPAIPGGGLTFASVRPGEAHTCGITTTQEAWCWGLNGAGQLGIGGVSLPVLTPTAVAGGLSFSRIAAGGMHTCALTVDGDAYCWGNNESYELGDGTQIVRTQPVRAAAGIRFGAIGVGSSYTCGLAVDGTVYCWGQNAAGQLGVDVPTRCFPANGNTTTYPCSPTPVAIAGGRTYIALAVSAFHACAVAADRSMYCWGGNYNGTLGDGTFTARPLPTRVVLPQP